MERKNKMNNDKEIINKIIYTSNVILRKELQHDAKIDLGLESCNMYDKLKTAEKKSVLRNIYLIYRQLGSLYLESNEYINSEIFFEKSLNIKYMNNYIDSLENECITKQMLAREKIMIYLNTNNERKIKEAKELIDFILENYDESWNEQFKKNFSETKKIYENVLKKDLKTIVTFEIPYHLLINDNKEISFEYKRIKCSINSKTIRTQESGFIIGDNIYTEKDKYGIVNHSIIKLIIGKYINGNELVQVNRYIDEVYTPLKEAVEVYNYFLKKYIVSTDKYWIPEINENMIFKFETIVLAGSIEIKNIPLSISMKLSSSGMNELSLKLDEIESIENELKNKDNEMWKLSLNYAKDYYLIKDYKNAIIMINIALENFTYYFATEILKKYISGNEIEKFFNGEVAYENYFLKDYIKKEDFVIAKNKGIIKDNPPTIYKIYSECYKYEQLVITKTQLGKKIAVIKDQRNEIVHGKQISKDLKYVSEKAIDEFENIVKLLIV